MQDVHIRNNSSLPTTIVLARLGLYLAGQKLTEYDQISINKKMYADGSVAFIVTDNNCNNEDWKLAAEGLARVIEERNRNVKRCSREL